jgi:hypothetical protein
MYNFQIMSKMENLTREQQLRYRLLHDCRFDRERARECFNFVMNDDGQQPCKPAPVSPADGVYVIYESGDYMMVNPEEGVDLEDKVAYIGLVSGGAGMAIALRDAAPDPVTLTDGNGNCASEEADFRPDYQDAVQDWAGRENTYRLQKSGLNPAIQLKEDEYIPSIAQLYLMCLNRKAINEALELAGGEPLTANWYWSSTEYSTGYAWYLGFNFGGAGLNAKAARKVRVRPVSAFIF